MRDLLPWLGHSWLNADPAPAAWRFHFTEPASPPRHLTVTDARTIRRYGSMEHAVV
jgi:hypothetical protein